MVCEVQYSVEENAQDSFHSRLGNRVRYSVGEFEVWFFSPFCCSGEFVAHSEIRTTSKTPRMGRRTVATGGAARRQSRLPRNPWKAPILVSPRMGRRSQQAQGDSADGRFLRPYRGGIGDMRVHGLRSSTRSTRGYIPRPHPGPMKEPVNDHCKAQLNKHASERILSPTRGVNKMTACFVEPFIVALLLGAHVTAKQECPQGRVWRRRGPGARCRRG